MKTQRRSVLKKVLAAFTASAGIFSETKAEKSADVMNMQVGDIEYLDDIPLYSSYTVFNNMVFVSGKSGTIEGDITIQTQFVLAEIEKQLIKAGSSLEKVLKVNVFLHDLNDYQAMNEAYKGRFGNKPPCRTTVAVYKGVPKNSLIELDCIGYI